MLTYNNEVLQRIIYELKIQNKKQYELTEFLGLNEKNFGNWKSGLSQSYMKYLHAIANFLGVSVEYLKGETDDKRPYDNRIPAPNITADYTTFPVLGSIAAGYDHVALEDWDGDTVDIPNSYLKGREKTEFFVLEVSGKSMMPDFYDGDKVLVLRQTSLDHSGQIGVIIYDGDYSTLKKVEYVPGEDWMELIPLNPAFSRIKIEGPALEQCKVLGVPKLLIRELN